MLNRPTPPPSAPSAESGNERERIREDILSRIRSLEARSIRGLFNMALFIIISIAALRDFSFLPSLPEDVRSFLGHPPTGNMISAVLVLYSFSAIILILTRMMSGTGEYSGIAHIGYLSVFYGFYHFAEAMEANFWAVFAAGMTVLALESYHIWTYCTEQVRKEKQNLADLERQIHREALR